MPTFEITAPDGRKFRVTAPEGATKEQALERVRAQPEAGAEEPKKKPRLNWRVTREDVANTLGDIRRLGEMVSTGVNQGVVDLIGLPANATTHARNVVTGEDRPTPSQMFSQWQAGQVAPPRNIGEQLVNTGAQFATGAKVPLPAAGAGAVSPAQQTAVAARQAGYKLPPSKIPSSGSGTRAVERFSNPRKTMEAAAAHNIPRTSENVAAEFGLPEGTELTPEVMKAVRKHAYDSGYGPIESLGKGYAQLIQTIREAREQAKSLFADYARNRRHETLQEARTAEAKVRNAENVLDGAVRQLGKPELYEYYVRARRTIAKAHDVERALIESTGDIKAATAAREFGKGAPQSEALEAAGRVSQAIPKAFKEAPPNSGFGLNDKLAFAGAAGGSGASLMTQEPKYAALAAAILAGRIGMQATRSGARKALLSEPVQDYMVFTTPEQRAQALARAMLGGYAGL